MVDFNKRLTRPRPDLIPAYGRWLDTIKRVRTLLSKPGRWSKIEFARTRDNLATNSTDDDAYSWGLCGAITRCSADPNENYALYAYVKRKTGIGNLLEWNEECEKVEEVLKLLDKLVKILEREIANESK